LLLISKKKSEKTKLKRGFKFAFSEIFSIFFLITMKD